LLFIVVVQLRNILTPFSNMTISLKPGFTVSGRIPDPDAFPQDS
jgi:hypothetical protein